MLRAAGAVAILLALAVGAGLQRPPATEGDVQPGEYSFYVQAPDFAFVGQTFEVVLALEHPFGTPMCRTSTTPPGCYQVAQWKLGFDAGLVTTSTAAILRDPAAPAECTPKYLTFSGASSNVLVACYDLGGPGLNYSGPAWHIAFTCLAPGLVGLPLITSVDNAATATWISDGTNDLPSHVHGDATTCINFDPDEDTDGDGCQNGREIGPDPIEGGDRDPLEFWDYFEVTGDNYIDLREVLLVLEHFGHGPTGDAMDNLLDRESPDPTKPWRSAEANDGIDLTDALTALAGHGHGCGLP